MRNKIPNKDEWRMTDADNSDRCWWWLASLFMAFTLVLIAASCQEEVAQVGIEEEGLPATVRLEVMPDAASQAQTRADESAIKNLHVLVYNNKGELIGKGYNNNSPTITVKTRSGSGCTIYAIANTGNATLFDGTIALTEAKLKTMKTAAIGSWDALTTASHLMMVGSKTGVTINAGSSTLKDGITVTRMVAKVTLNIGIKLGSGITVTNYRVCDLPKLSHYVQDDTKDAVETTNATHWVNSPDITSLSTSFYMYENRRGVNNQIKVQKDKHVGNAFTRATYVEIKGKVKGKVNGSLYDATWRVYLGGDTTSDFNMKRNTPYMYNITLNQNEADTRITTDECYDGSPSNCYMVLPGHGVTIPVVQANESFLSIGGIALTGGKCIQITPTTAWTAEIVWTSVPKLIILEQTDGKGAEGRFTVKSLDSSDKAIQGNAVVAIKNAKGEILWSWHIWITTYDGSATFQHNGNAYNPVFMDRALGATSTTAGDLNSCGLYYQWGRKDPTPGLGQIGGRWNIIDTDDPIRVYNSTGASYAISKAATTSICLSNAIRKPDTHYYFSVESLSDWFTSNASLQNGSLWGGRDITLPNPAPKTVFDPCPNGWRVPPYLKNTSPFQGMATGVPFVNNGANFGVNGYFPASGWRAAYSGNIHGAGKTGHYWSASPTGVKSGRFTINSNGTTEVSSDAGRAAAFPVRCIKE